MWVWENKSWGKFHYKKEIITPLLIKTIQATAPLKELAETLTQDQRLKWEADNTFKETLASAAIEGEIFDRASVTSSIANKLGLYHSESRFEKTSDAFVELLLRAIRFVDPIINHAILKDWHKQMFIEKPILGRFTVGEYRNDKMQIVSGSYGKQRVDFEAPCRSLNEVNQEMGKFIKWLNQDDSESLYIKSAIAKFYFVTIHPFDDGNGRLSRIIAERLLAQAENSNLRLFSLSRVIEEYRKEYYQELNTASKGDGDLTNWIVWYLNRVIEATQDSKQTFHKILATTRFWQEHYNTSLNERQTKFIKRLLDTDDFADGITRQKYQSLTKTTTITANRDLKNLVDKGIVEVSGTSRSTRYFIKALND